MILVCDPVEKKYFHEFFKISFFNFFYYREVQESPFVERLIKKGYEVLFLDEAVDEYCLSAIPEFEGKKFQNVAKDGFNRLVSRNF